MNNEQKAAGFDDLEFKDVEIERNGETRTFRVREINRGKGQVLLDTKKKNGAIDKDKAKVVDAKLVAASVTRLLKAEGVEPLEQKITFDEAQAMGMSLFRQLLEAAMNINGIGAEAEDEKN